MRRDLAACYRGFTNLFKRQIFTSISFFIIQIVQYLQLYVLIIFPLQIENKMIHCATVLTLLQNTNNPFNIIYFNVDHT